jgi:integrase
MQTTQQEGVYYINLADGSRLEIRNIGQNIPRAGMPWEEFKGWFANYSKVNLSPASHTTDLLMIRRLELYKRPEYLEDITPDYLLGFKVWLEVLAQRQRIGAAGRNRMLLGVKIMMRAAESWGKIKYSQNWTVVKRDKRENGPRKEWHPLEELRQIKGVLKGDLLTTFLLGWEEGLRRGEIAHLYKTDYNPVAHTITICAKADWRPKTKKSARTIPLRPDSEAAIQASIARAPADSLYIINIIGDRSKKRYLWQYRYKVKCALPHIKTYLHKLRHTYSSLLGQQGVSLKMRAALMGHVRIQQTADYEHFNWEHLAEATERLPRT